MFIYVLCIAICTDCDTNELLQKNKSRAYLIYRPMRCLVSFIRGLLAWEGEPSYTSTFRETQLPQLCPGDQCSLRRWMSGRDLTT